MIKLASTYDAVELEDVEDALSRKLATVRQRAVRSKEGSYEVDDGLLVGVGLEDWELLELDL
jgi:hypothetical protein